MYQFIANWYSIIANLWANIEYQWDRDYEIESGLSLSKPFCFPSRSSVPLFFLLPLFDSLLLKVVASWLVRDTTKFLLLNNIASVG